MSKTTFSDETRFEYSQKLAPFLDIDSISETKDALFYQGYWRSSEAYRQARDIVGGTNGQYSVKVQDFDEKGTVRVTKKSYSGDKPKYWLHALLFGLTILTTLFF